MTIQEKPLEFCSFQALKEKCMLESSATIRFKQQSPEKSLSLLITLTDKAKQSLREGNAENAFMLYRRALDVCQIVSSRNSSDMIEFKKSPDGTRFFDLSCSVIKTVENLNEQLQIRYKLKEEDRLETEKSRNSLSSTSAASNHALSVLHPPVVTNQPEDFELYIKAQQLVRYVEDKKTSALILDYRTEKPKLVEYTRIANAITVAQMDPLALVPGCILSMLACAMDISDRPLLKSISRFDLVVLMGDTNEVKKPFAKLPKSSTTKVLYEALTTYNMRDKLKHAPLVLEYGFQGWDMAYSCYTKEGLNYQKEQSMEDAFGTLLADALKANGLNISYPELIKPASNLFQQPLPSTTKLEDAHSMEVIQPTVSYPADTVHYPSYPTTTFPVNEKIGFRPTPTPRTIQQPSNLLEPKMSGLSVSENKKPTTLTPSDPPKLVQPTIPNIDRTTKPAAVARPSPFPVDQDCTLPSMDKENVHPIPILASCAASSAMYTLDPMKKGLPAVQTLGGAKVANPDQLTHPALPHYPSPASVQRPPTPDRSTKVPLLNNINQVEKPTPHLFYQVYNAAMKNIEDESKHGSTLPGYTGLYNLKNTCFMNTTLQALFNTPGFADLFINKRVGRHINMSNVKFGTMGVISGCFAALMDSVWSGKYATIRPIFFLDTFAHRVNQELADRRQHDAQEFQMFLLDALHEDTSKINQGRPFEQNYNGQNLIKEADDYLRRQRLLSNSVINDIFHSRTVSRISCTICTSASVTFEEMSQISVELPSHAVQSYTDFNECLQRHFADVLLDGQSRWNCPRCKSPQVAGRSTKIWMLPPILVVHMKRFSLDGGEYIKNEIEVGFDIAKLDMSNYVHEKAPIQNPYYSLYAVTNHDGRLNSGHYTSCVKNLRSGEWLKFDDEVCSRINPSSITTKKAFILYYANTANSSSESFGGASNL